MIKTLLATACAASFSISAAIADDLTPNPAEWDQILENASGQTVYWNAWGGSGSINDYIAWVGETLEERHDIKVRHVKLDDTANAVSTVLAEKSAGRDEGGTIDLIWINGENFAAMKREGMLYGPGWVQDLPNWTVVDHETKPTITTDFTLPVDGMASPWGMAKLVFFYDSARTEASDLPDNTDDLLAWAKENPGRFAYPQPPDFIGSSFLKQVLIERVDDKSVLAAPVVEADFAEVTKPLFNYLDQLNEVAWRKGQAFPKDYPSMSQMLADGEVDITFAFNPADASAAIAEQRLPDTVRSFTFSGGTLSNTHFVSIPYNASAKEGALVLANFLISPEAQARKQDPNVWGDPTVLAMDKLEEADRGAFDALDLGIATLPPAELGPAFEEPHPTWMNSLERAWSARYGVAN
ncbi:MAG: ABC transporter substrate-binding protein [Pseudomonadota bacterium]